MSRIGFVLLTHTKPHQIGRLVMRLSTMFDAPPIVIHHDFGKCPLDEGEFPAHVSFVRPHVSTEWARFSLVEATLQALTLLTRRPDSPEWCVLLSGDSYPTKPAGQILETLSEGGFDAHIQNALVSRETVISPPLLPADPLDRLTPEWFQTRYDRYCVKRISVPSVDKRLRPKKRVLRLPEALGRRFLPFTPQFQCHAGSQWFTVSRRAAEYIANFPQTPAGAALVRHYRDLRITDESFFQTIVCNAPALKVSYFNHLYMDWSEHWAKRTGHPKRLTLADLDALEASPTHFARKIDIDTDAALLDALDQLIDVKHADRKEAVAL